MASKRKLYRQKTRWYERNSRSPNRRRIEKHMQNSGAYIRFPVEGNVLEALDDGRLQIGEGTLLEPGCWLTLSAEARIRIGQGCFLNRETMLAASELIEIGDHVMFANHCFVGDSDHAYDDPERPITHQVRHSLSPTPQASHMPQAPQPGSGPGRDHVEVGSAHTRTFVWTGGADHFPGDGPRAVGLA